MFADIISLYRSLGSPQLSPDFSCRYLGPVDQATRDLAQRCTQMGAAFGSVELEPEDNGDVSIEIQMPRNDNGRVYLTFSDLLRQTPTLAFGALPAHFYVADIDYCSGDQQKPDVIGKLERLAKFIKLLSKLADDRADVGRTNRLLFILATDAAKVRKTALAEIKMDEAALAFELPHLGLLEQLVAEENASKLHVEERLLIMRSVIAEVLATADKDANDLTFLCENWKTIQQKYRINFQAYIQTFAFDDVRKKIIDAELDYASKVTGVFGDVAGKMLALPVSLAAIAAVSADAKASLFFPGCAGLVLVTIVIVFVLRNIRAQVTRLQSGLEFVFAPLFEKTKSYPQKLQGVLKQRQAALTSQVRLTSTTFNVFVVLSFAPTAGAIWKLLERYPQLIDWFHAIAAQFVHMVVQSAPYIAVMG